MDFRPKTAMKEIPMRKSRFSEAQIVAILHEFDAGTPADELSLISRDFPGAGGGNRTRDISLEG